MITYCIEKLTGFEMRNHAKKVRHSSVIAWEIRKPVGFITRHGRSIVWLGHSRFFLAAHQRFRGF